MGALIAKYWFQAYSSTESVKQISEAVDQKESTVDPADVDHHEKFSDIWWTKGHAKILHSMNPIRIQLVRDGLANGGFKEVDNVHSLEGLKILDVGCGGGILTEPLARMGANVTGIDASSRQITVAKEHATLDPSLSGRLTYIHTTIEETASTQYQSFDVVVASEILEHVLNPELFLKSCADTLKPGGSIFVTTFNRTLQSWLIGILGSEYLFRVLPRGTHDWNKFVSPEETRRLLEKYGCKTKLVHGMFYHPLKEEWSWSDSTAINYAIHAIKHEESNQS